MTNSVKRIVDGLNDIREALHSKTRRIYHYTSPSGLLGILAKEGGAKLYFTQYDSLNDRSERIHAEKCIKKVCENYLQQKKINREFHDIVLKCLEPQKAMFTYPSSQNPNWVSGKMHEFDTYLCCFSANEDSLPMWNYYSKSEHYEGYCIGFYIDGESKGFLQGYRLDVVKVVYKDSEKNELIKNLILPIYSQYKKYRKKAEDYSWLIAELQEGIEDMILAFKDEHFSHEEEIRMILKVPVEYRETGHGNISERKHRASSGYIVPYIEYTFEKDAVCEIHVAPLLEPEIAKRNVEDLLKQRKYSHVIVLPSKAPIRY